VSAQTLAPERSDSPGRPGASAPARAIGGVLFALGLVADLEAGRWVLDGHTLPGFLVHPLAIVFWLAGLAALSARGRGTLLVWPRAGALRAGHPAGQRPTTAPVDPVVSGRLLAAALLGLGTLPGLGPLACSVALAISGSLPGRGAVGAASADPAPAAPVSPRREPVDQLRELEIQPLVDVLASADHELKRGAIEALGEQPSARAVQALRQLLVDPHPDVRSGAGVMLFRLEAEFGREMRQAAGRAAEAPASAASLIARGAVCYRYAASGLPGERMARFYLLEAADALARGASSR